MTPTPPQMPDVHETIWISNANMSIKEVPDGSVVLSLTLPNNRRYVIPLDANAKAYLHRETSPIKLADSMPRNGPSSAA